METPVLQEIRSRLDLTEDLRPPTPSHTTTLRVKSEQAEQVKSTLCVVIHTQLSLNNATRPSRFLSTHKHIPQQTYVLKMKYSDSIGDVRNHINKLRYLYML